MENNVNRDEFGNDVDEDSESENEHSHASDAAVDIAEEVDVEDQKNSEDKEKHQITFNKALPREHSYLGDDLEEVEGRTILDDDSLVRLPLMSLPGIILLPGQMLPLNLFQPTAIAMIKYVLDQDKTFGLVTGRVSAGGYHMQPASIGCTAEVLAIKEENDDHSGLSRMRIKAIGRQRFEIISYRQQIDGIIMANARILSEQILAHPLEDATPVSHMRFVHGKPLSFDSMTVSDGALKTCLQQWLKLNKKSKVDRFSAAYFTHWPMWVYQQYDWQWLMKAIEKELQSWNDTFELDKMPRDASTFSFWVASVLPVNDDTRLKFLSMNSPIQRLRYELSIMKNCTVLCCGQCSLPVARKEDVFSMSVEGPLGAYVNPGGYVHETLTVYKAQGLVLFGIPSRESSWFTGYAWTIAQCRVCHSHMGWKFSVAGDLELKPEMFWGLCRSALSPKLVQEDEAT